MKNDTVKIDRAEYEALMRFPKIAADARSFGWTESEQARIDDAYSDWLKATAQRRAGEMF